MRPGQVRNAFIAEREVREDAPPCRIGQRRESAIQHLGGIFNHLVNYIAASLALFRNQKYRTDPAGRSFSQNTRDTIPALAAGVSRNSGASKGWTLLFRLFAGACLGEREALRFLATRGAFLYVVPAFAVSHKTFTLTLPRPVPSDFAESREGRGLGKALPPLITSTQTALTPSSRCNSSPETVGSIQVPSSLRPD